MRSPDCLPIGLALALACSVTSRLDAQTVAAAEHRAIDSANARAVRAFNAGDVAGFARVYTADATVLPANGARISGRPAITQWWQGAWGAGLRNLKLATDELEVHGSSASEVGRYELDAPAPGGALVHDHGKYVVLWKRSPKGEWQWSRDIYNSDVATPSPATATAGDTVWVVAYKVRPDKRAQFEGFVSRFWRAGLEYGTRQDSTMVAEVRHTRVLYPTQMNSDSTYTYAFIMDPVIHGADYVIRNLAGRVYPPAQAAEELRAFNESIARDKSDYQIVLSMTQH